MLFKWTVTFYIPNMDRKLIPQIYTTGLEASTRGWHELWTERRVKKNTWWWPSNSWWHFYVCIMFFKILGKVWVLMSKFMANKKHLYLARWTIGNQWRVFNCSEAESYRFALVTVLAQAFNIDWILLRSTSGRPLNNILQKSNLDVT